MLLNTFQMLCNPVRLILIVRLERNKTELLEGEKCMAIVYKILPKLCNAVRVIVIVSVE